MPTYKESQGTLEPAKRLRDIRTNGSTKTRYIVTEGGGAASLTMAGGESISVPLKPGILHPLRTVHSDAAPGRIFDGTSGISLFSPRIQAAFNGEKGALFARAKVAGSGTWIDGVNRSIVSISSGGGDAIQLAKTATGDLNSSYLGGSDSFSENTTGYFSYGLSWNMDDNEVIHTDTSGAETISIQTLTMPAINNLAAGQDPTGAGFWEGAISHIVLFLSPLDDTQRNRIHSLISSGNIDATQILSLVGADFVLWTLYPDMVAEVWGEDLALPTTFYAPYNGDEPYNTNFNGSDNSYNGVTPSNLVGAAVFRPGLFGKARQITEATENLIPNPCFGDGTETGWSKSSQLNLTFGTDDPYIGNYYATLTATDVDQSITSQPPISMPAGVDVTLSVVYRGSGEDILIVDYDGGFSVLGTKAIPDSTEWATVSLTVGLPAGGNPQIAAVIGVNDASNLDIGAVQLEQKAYGTMLAYGEEPGVSWSGVAHNSSSVRGSHTVLRYDVTEKLNNNSGTFLMWVKTIAENSPFDTYAIMYTTGANRLFLVRNSGDYLRVYSSNGGYLLTHDGYSAENQWRQIGMTWDDVSGSVLYIDGVAVDTSSSNIFSGLTIGDNFHIGNLYPTSQINGLVDDVTMFSRALTAAEIASIYSSGQPYDPTRNYT